MLGVLSSVLLIRTAQRPLLSVASRGEVELPLDGTDSGWTRETGGSVLIKRGHGGCPFHSGRRTDSSPPSRRSPATRSSATARRDPAPANVAQSHCDAGHVGEGKVEHSVNPAPSAELTPIISRRWELLRLANTHRPVVFSAINFTFCVPVAWSWYEYGPSTLKVPGLHVENSPLSYMDGAV